MVVSPKQQHIRGRLALPNTSLRAPFSRRKLFWGSSLALARGSFPSFLLGIASLLLLTASWRIAARSTESSESLSVEVPKFSQSQSKQDLSNKPPPKVNTLQLKRTSFSVSPSSSTENETPPLTVHHHIVERGETLSSIADRYSLQIGTLISFNKIKNVDSVTEGSRLVIPQEDGVLYTVKEGERFASLALLSGRSASELAELNRLTAASIKPGEKLFIPGLTIEGEQQKRAVGNHFLFPAQGEVTRAHGAATNPETEIPSYSYGIRITNFLGTPVKATQSGHVSATGVHPFYGRYLIVNHRGGFQSLYANLQHAEVSLGDKVLVGQPLGTMGTTGFTKIPQLFFALFSKGKDLDPLAYLY